MPEAEQDAPRTLDPKEASVIAGGFLHLFPRDDPFQHVRGAVSVPLPKAFLEAVAGLLRHK